MTYDDYDLDEEEDFAVDCPRCGQSIFDGIDQCPHCREFLSSGDFQKPFPKWILILVVLTILSFLFPYLAILLRGPN